MVSQKLNLSLPTGPLGLGIQKHETTGLIFVTSTENEGSPLRLKDVIFSMNGIQLADVEGGVDAVVQLFVGFASGPRNVVVKRGVAAPPPPVSAPPTYAMAVASAAAPVHQPSATNEERSDGRGAYKCGKCGAPKVGHVCPYRSSNGASSIDGAPVASAVPANRPSSSWTNGPGTYKARVLAAITELKDRTGSSLYAIKGHVQAAMPANKTWQNATFLSTLKKLVADGDLIQINGMNGKYKLSASYKARTKALKKSEQAKKTKNAASTKKPAPVARASLSPVPGALVPATMFRGPAANGPAANMFSPFHADNATAEVMPPRKPAPVARVSLSPVAVAPSKAPPKTNFLCGYGDIARKALEIANSSNSANATANAQLSNTLQRVQQEQQSRAEAYKAGVISAINSREKQAGSGPTLKKIVKAAAEANGEQFHDSAFNQLLRKMVQDGELLQEKSTYSLSASLATGQPMATGIIHGQEIIQNGVGSGVPNSSNADNTASSAPAPGTMKWKCDFGCGAIYETYELAEAHELICEKNPGGTNTTATAESQPERIVVVATKPSQESSLGISIQQENASTVTVSSIASTSLLAGTQLKVGMEIVSVDGHSFTTVTEAAALFKAAEGQVTIVAAAPKPTLPVGGGGSAAPPMMDWRMEAARIAAGYTPSVAPQP